jgi:polyphosphate glucokinase
MEGILGIDVGGTGIKGAIVDPKTGELLTERIKVKTPKPATPDAVLKIVKDIKRKLHYTGEKIGLGYPGIIKNGISMTAANVDKSWINYEVSLKYSKALNAKVFVINDADAAGLAEMKFGKMKKQKGKVLFLTIGTGIGSAPFIDGKLWANTELGHIKYKKTVAEKYAGNGARVAKNQSWKVWGAELNNYLSMLEFYLSPDTIIIGGGISKEFNAFKSFIKINTPVIPASLQNAAGVIGAAMAASDNLII